MPQPAINQVHQNVPLTNISIAYMQNEKDYIADKVFPLVPVEKKADSYYTYDKDDWFRDEAKQRSPGTESTGSGYGLSTATYNCDTWAFHKDVPWDVANNADAVINMDRDATEFVTGRLLLRREILFASTYFKANVWGKDYTGVAGAPGAGEVRQWSDYTNSDPIADMSLARSYVKKMTGYRPNTLTISDDVFEILKSHPDILERYKYTQAGVITADLIAKVFEVDRLLVASAIKATNKEGQTAAMDWIFSKGALLTYAPPTPGLLQPSAGYTFAWKNLANAKQNGFGVSLSKFAMKHLKSDRVEGEMAIDMKVVASDCGAFFATVIA